MIDFILDHLGWVLLLLTAAFIMGYKKYTKNNYAITSKYLETRNYDVPFPELLEAINSAMIKAGFREVNVSPRTGAFVGQTGFSMSSWMEFIEIRCEQSPTGTALKFLSICALPTQIYAWGKNRRNAIRFFRELENQLHASVR